MHGYAYIPSLSLIDLQRRNLNRGIDYKINTNKVIKRDISNMLNRNNHLFELIQIMNLASKLLCLE